MMHFIRLAAIALCLWPGIALGQLAKPSSVQETMEWLADAFEAVEIVTKVTIDHTNERLIIDTEKEDEIYVFPHNIHTLLLGIDNADDRQFELDFRVQALVESLLTNNEAISAADLDRLYPVLRHQSMKHAIAPDDPGQAIHVSRQLGDADILYVIDSEKSVSFLQVAEVEILGLSNQKLQEIALGNLEKKFDDLTIEGDGLYFLVLDGFYESSFVIYPSFWQEIAAQIPELMMAFPARDLVIFVDASQPRARETLQDIVAEFGQSAAYPVSDLVYTWDGNGWQVAD